VARGERTPPHRASCHRARPRRAQVKVRLADVARRRPRAPERPPEPPRLDRDRALACTIREHAARAAGRDPSSGAGERSSCVTHSPDSPPCGRRTGRGVPLRQSAPPPPPPPVPVTRAAVVNSLDGAPDFRYLSKKATQRFQPSPAASLL